jgi:hypothetical protein
VKAKLSKKQEQKNLNQNRSLALACAGELDAATTVLRFYYVDSPPPLSVGLFFIHNHADGSYSGMHCHLSLPPLSGAAPLSLM